jgi:hypothetical protein
MRHDKQRTCLKLRAEHAAPGLGTDLALNDAMKKPVAGNKQEMKVPKRAPQKSGATRSPDASTVGKDGRNAHDKDGNEAQSKSRQASANRR